MRDNRVSFQEGVSDPPSISSISRLLRGGSRDPDGKKDYSIDGILGGEFFKRSFILICCLKVPNIQWTTSTFIHNFQIFSLNCLWFWIAWYMIVPVRYVFRSLKKYFYNFGVVSVLQLSKNGTHKCCQYGIYWQ